MTPEQIGTLDAFEAKFLSEDYRNLLRSRLVRYFEDNRDELVAPDGKFDKDKASADIRTFMEGLVGTDADMKRAFDQFKSECALAETEILAAVQAELEPMQQDTIKAVEWAQDFTVNVEVKPETLQAAAGAVCSITIKSTIRNYTWSKVDDDPQDIHSIRTLSPE
jgi:hypothetical protein